MDHMEGQEEFAGSNDHNTQMIIKGKRTKRRRPSSPAMTSTSSCGDGDGVSGGGANSISSPTASSGIYESTEEDEDMANCLILLARGDYDHKMEERSYSSRRFTDVYKCKTCDRIFSSFQALGGHRASHKKPKSMAAEEKKTQVLASTDDFNQEKQFNRTSLHLISDTQIPNKSFTINSKNKIHECSICGAEFTSGQALGGHMRRHRASATVASSHEADNKSRNILALDLNLPAPAEDDHHHRESKFQFVSTQPPLIFSSPALVDCHY